MLCIFLHMYVCMYVYKYVCMHVFMYVCTVAPLSSGHIEAYDIVHYLEVLFVGRSAILNNTLPCVCKLFCSSGKSTRI